MDKSQWKMSRSSHPIMDLGTPPLLFKILGLHPPPEERKYRVENASTSLYDLTTFTPMHSVPRRLRYLTPPICLLARLARLPFIAESNFTAAQSRRVSSQTRQTLKRPRGPACPRARSSASTLAASPANEQIPSTAASTSRAGAGPRERWASRTGRAR